MLGDAYSAKFVVMSQMRADLSIMLLMISRRDAWIELL